MAGSFRLAHWPLRVATFSLVLGTAKYVERDVFHADDSQAQAIIEIGSIALGACLALAVAVYYRIRISLRAPSVLLFGSLFLTLSSSFRSWDPMFSLTRGGLLLLISASTILLLQTYGLKPCIRSLLNGYCLLIAFGVLAGIFNQDELPLLLHDPGDETGRARLHLFRIHPIALADDCAICLILSVLLTGRWMRVLRLVFITCLLLTVARASIIFGLLLYFAAEFLAAPNLLKGVGRLGSVGVVGIVCLAVVLAVIVIGADWSAVEELSGDVSHIAGASWDGTLNGRTAFWSLLISDLSQDNLYGYGVGGARYYLRSVNPRFSHSHNSALETIYMSGYMGLAMMIAALSGVLFECFIHRRNATARVILAVALYVIAAGMMNPSWYETSSLVALSMACGVSFSSTEVSRHRALDRPVMVAS